ncbi:hypothetical protein [Flavobacterium aestivum]|uniref:hypothetical protein n=1 Tax=Flavobacterium aestivum TaxID=3003257 RepID=UPI002285EFF5|nr:hypothetical protein [Flavobacterium aestivum]
MWFDINWNVYGVQNLPNKWRDVISIQFIKVLLRPINDIYYKWYNWRIENIYKLEHTGQICYSRGSLNDKFDPIERRIYITDGLEHDTFYIYTEAEDRTIWLYTEAENKTIYLRTEAETADTGLDFIVYVPLEIYNTQKDSLIAHIEFYRVAGKRYKIITNE